MLNLVEHEKSFITSGPGKQTVPEFASLGKNYSIRDAHIYLKAFNASWNNIVTFCDITCPIQKISK